MATRLVIIGGGPAGNAAATRAATLGAQVTLVERDIIGGAAHLWDCVPSKAMIATGGAMSYLHRVEQMGLREVGAEIDLDALRERLVSIEDRLEASVTDLLDRQKVRILRGTGRMTGPNTVVAETVDGDVTLPADAVLLSTGSRPRIPDWAEPDGDRVLTTRQAYPPKVLPEHVAVIGSGVTGVEFVHLFASMGSKVTLVVSRQQVLPQKDPEVAAALEENFLSRDVKLLKGARATGLERGDDGVTVLCDDGRRVDCSHVLLAVGSLPNSEALGLHAAGVESENGYVPVDQHLRSNVGHIYAAGDLSGKLPLSSVAAMQGRKIADHVMGLHTREHRHLDYDKAASAIFTEPEIADVGL
ncbi:MAG TPA: FAD-dependent oxidoreductase, partial [Acidimicrobiales bacterium]|nr:FAD-dependent oxidoreductase [Acidimicrobiales bacterium]